MLFCARPGSVLSLCQGQPVAFPGGQIHWLYSLFAPLAVCDGESGVCVCARMHAHIMVESGKAAALHSKLVSINQYDLPPARFVRQEIMFVFSIKNFTAEKKLSREEWMDNGCCLYLCSYTMGSVNALATQREIFHLPYLSWQWNKPYWAYPFSEVCFLCTLVGFQ